MTFEWNLNWLIGIAITVAILLIKLIAWWRNRQKITQVTEPEISLSQDDPQEEDSEVFLLEDGTVFTNASLGLSNDSLVPVQIKSFMLNEHHMIKKQGQFVDGSNQFRLAGGKVMQNRAKPSIPKLPCTIQPKDNQDFSVWFETPGLTAPDAGDMTARLVVRNDKNLVASFTILIHRYNEPQQGAPESALFLGCLGAEGKDRMPSIPGFPQRAR